MSVGGRVVRSSGGSTGTTGRAFVNGGGTFMSATYRALASVVMLIGFYVVALLQLAAVIALGVWLFGRTAGVITGKLLLPLVVALGAVGIGRCGRRSVRSTSRHPAWSWTSGQRPALGHRARAGRRGRHPGARQDPAGARGERGGQRAESCCSAWSAAGARSTSGCRCSRPCAMDQLRLVLAHELGRLLRAGTPGSAGWRTGVGWPSGRRSSGSARATRSAGCSRATRCST